MDPTTLAALFGGGIVAAAAGCAGWLLRARHDKASTPAGVMQAHTDALHSAAAEFAKLPASFKAAAQDVRMALTAPVLGLAPHPAGEPLTPAPEVPVAATFPVAPAAPAPAFYSNDAVARLAAFNPGAHPGAEAEHLAATLASLRALMAAQPVPVVVVAPTPEPAPAAQPMQLQTEPGATVAAAPVAA